MSMFAGIGSARTSEGGNYVRCGSHIFVISALKSIITRKKKPAFVAELIAVSSIPGSRLNGEPVAAHIKEEAVSWFVSLDDPEGPGLGNVKSFLAAAADIDIEEVDEAGALAAVSAAQPFAGMMVKCSATEIQTRNGGLFTKCVFSNHSEE